MQFWSGAFLKIEISGPQGGSEVSVPHPYALVGALAKADVRLTGPGVQKRDALLIATAGKLICRRLEATLPEAYREIQPDDWLELGESRLRARTIAAPAGMQPDESVLANSEARLRIPVLRVRHKRRPSVNRRLYAEVQLVGRAPDCEVELHCPQASLYHCALVRDPNGLWCIDLGSGNGTYLNGQRIDCALVEMGGRLKVGDFELEFQRFSRRSASASGLGENASGSNLSLGLPSLATDVQAETVSRGSNIGVQASDSVFGSKIIDSTAEVIPPTLSGLTIQPAVSADDLRILTAKQAELMSEKTDLQRGLAELTEQNARLRSTQEAQAQEFSQRLDEQRTALVEELKQQSQADRQALFTDLLSRLEELRPTQAQELLSNLDSQRQSLSQELLGRLEDFRQSEAHELSTRLESLQQSLSQELLGRLEETRRSEKQELSTHIDSLRQTLSQEIVSRLAELQQIQTSETATSIDAKWQSLSQDLLTRLEALGNSQSAQLVSQASNQRQIIADEVSQRLDELAKSQAQQLKLQADTQRHALTQELARRLETELESRVQQVPTASDPVQQVVGQQWLQRLEDLRNGQSEEIALAVAAQGQALSQEIVQRLEERHKAQGQKLASQIEQQRQSLYQELSRQLEAQAAQSRELLTKTESQRQEELQKAQARQFADQVELQRRSMSEEVARHVEPQVARSAEFLARLESQWQDEKEAQAKQFAVQIEQQRQSLFQELSRQLESQAAQSRELLTKSATQRQEELHKIQAQQLAAQIDQQRQSLSQELLSQLEIQSTALLKEQQAHTDALNQRLQPLLASLEQLVSQQSQLSSGLASQAEQIQVTRRALQELQHRVDQQRAVPTSHPEYDAPVFEADDSDRQVSIAALDSDIHGAMEPGPGSDIAVLPQPRFEEARIDRKPAPIPEDDRLLHFVSDRLAEMDTGRQRRVVVYWAIAIAAAGILCVLAWLLRGWIPGLSS